MLGCARQSRRGCRAGKRARDRRPSNVNNNTGLSSADRSTFAIPTLSTRSYGSVIGTGQLYHGRREGRIAVRRAIQLNSQPVSRSSTTLGLLNARSVGKQGYIHLRPHRRRPSSSVRCRRDVARLCRQSSANRLHAA